MPVYQYETLPAVPDGPVRRFELKQSMNDRPLEKHPETGEPVRRVISGGFLMLKPGASSGGDGAGAMASSAPCGGSCACHP